MARILVAGCGDVGTLTALQWCAAGHQVTGLRRHVEALPREISGFAADLTEPASLTGLGAQNFDLVMVSSAAGAFTAEAYQRVYVEGLKNLLASISGTPSWLLVSSTGVYHQTDGEWVNEESPTCPTAFSGQALLRAEQLLAERVDGAFCVLRLGGIYGPGRNRLLDEVRAGRGCVREPVQYTNRIHRDDCAGALAHLGACLLAGKPTSRLYLGVDNEPAPMWEVRHWIGGQLGISLDDSTGGSSSRGGNKRCSNARLLGSGYRFQYPDFRAGYGAMIKTAVQTDVIKP